MDPIDEIGATLIDIAGTIRANLPGRGSAGAENPSGEVQRKGDLQADDLLADSLGNIDGVGSFASEEREAVLDVGDGLSVTVDPLDGSSNLRSNNTVGTIVAAYDAPLPAHGDDLLAAWFVLYGPLTTIVSTRGESVVERVIVDGDVYGERSVTIPSDPTVYGFGGRVPDWPNDFDEFADDITHELKLRYGGAMVADVNQILSHGGIFSYPALKSAPEGKLRVQFEGYPMGAIVEAAGGASSNGSGSLMAVEPTELHQRTPFHVGNAALIERLEAALD